MSQARHLHIAQCRSRVFGLATCSVQKAAQPSTELSPATAELQRWGDGDGGGGGGGRGGGGETQWAHAAHLPASDRERRALVARAVHTQRCARVRAAAHSRCCSPPACRSFGTPASEGHRGASACKRSGPQTQGPARQPASRAPELARRRLPAQVAARGPLFGPRRSRTTCTCSAGSDPTRVKEEAPEPNCEGLCWRRQKGRPGPGARVSHMLRCSTFFLTAPASAALDIRIARHLGSASARRRRARRWRRWRWRGAHRACAALAPASAVRRAAPRRALRGLAVSRAGRRAGFSCSSGRVRRAHRNEQRGRARHMDAHRERRDEKQGTNSR